MLLGRRGEGIHHIGYAVADIGAALAGLGGGGRQIRLIDERPRHGSMDAAITFLHAADLGGVLTKLVQPAIRGPTGPARWAPGNIHYVTMCTEWRVTSLRPNQARSQSLRQKGTDPWQEEPGSRR